MTRPLPMPIGTMLAGKYRIDSVLGTGGMGTVFAAVNIDLGRQVAIKVLHNDLARDDDLVRRLRQEARAAAAIGHPGIVDVLDLGTTGAGDPFIVMERLDGEPLGARLANRVRLPPAIAVGILQKAVEALIAAHAKGIVHRDLKPDNIFLIIRPFQGVKLVDFGIAKLQNDNLSITQSGVVMGTPLYMSPEQARGATDIGPPSDLYAIGAILYQTLAGVPPHLASNYNEMLAKVLMQEPTPLAIAVPELPRSLTELVHELLAKPAELRPTAFETANRLRLISRELDGSTIAFSPTLQPDNVSDEERTVDERGTTLRPSHDLDEERTIDQVVPPRPSLLYGDTAPPRTSEPLGVTVSTLPPRLGETSPAIVARPIARSDEMLAATAPPITAQLPAARHREPRSSRLVIVLVALLAVVVGAIVIVLATRTSQAPIDAAQIDAGRADEMRAIDASSVAVDVRIEVDAAVVEVARDAGVEVARDARDTRNRDAAISRDATISRDAAVEPVAVDAAPAPDAAAPHPDAATGSNGLEIDPDNPITRPRR